MRIEIKLNDKNYAIDVETNQYIPVKFSTNQDEKSANFGKVTEQQLGYFTKLPNAAARLCREEIWQSDDIVSLKEFAYRVETINRQLIEQLEVVSV